MCAAASIPAWWRSIASEAGKTALESAARAAAALSVRAAARIDRRRDAGPGAFAHQPVDRRAQAPDAEAGEGRPDRRARRPGRLPGDRRPAGAAPGDLHLAFAPVPHTGAPPGDPGAARQRHARGAVRLRPDGGCARLAGRLPQPVLPNL